MSSRLEKFESLIEKVKQEDSSLGRCINYLENLSSKNLVQLFYFGGFLRDLWLGKVPRDIDIVFSSIPEEYFSYLVENHFVRKNRFGGLKLKIEDTEVDAWIIEKTEGFVRSGYHGGPHRLPETTFFNVEGIVLEVWAPEKYARWGWEQGFFKACEDKIIEIQSTQGAYPTPYPLLQLARTHNLHEKLGWKIGHRLKQFTKNNLNKTSPSELAEIYQYNYNREINPIKIYKSLEELANLL